MPFHISRSLCLCHFHFQSFLDLGAKLLFLATMYCGKRWVDIRVQVPAGNAYISGPQSVQVVALHAVHEVPYWSEQARHT